MVDDAIWFGVGVTAGTIGIILGLVFRKLRLGNVEDPKAALGG